MRSNFEQHDSGWVSLQFLFRPEEIDRLIESLQDLRAGRLGHFHFRCDDFDDSPGVADVEFSTLSSNETENLQIE